MLHHFSNHSLCPVRGVEAVGNPPNIRAKAPLILYLEVKSESQSIIGRERHGEKLGILFMKEHKEYWNAIACKKVKLHVAFEHYKLHKRGQSISAPYRLVNALLTPSFIHFLLRLRHNLGGSLFCELSGQRGSVRLHPAGHQRQQGDCFK